jgi:integrase
MPVSAPRRTRSTVPGIYYRITRGGQRTYEFTYRDGAGRQRWQCGYATLGAARDDRAALRRRRRRGERIVSVKATFEQFAREWLAAQHHLRPSTRERYRWAIEVRLIPRFGRFRLADIREDDVAILISDCSATLRPSSVRAIITVLARILGHAVRRGALPVNPVSGLERWERPKGRPREMRILQRDEIGRFLAAAPTRHRPLLATLVFCGLRIGEALALRWSDIDLAAGRVRVRWQIDAKTGNRVEPKTIAAKRDIVLMPALAKLLAAHRIASPYCGHDDPVFASRAGTPLLRSNVRARILRPAIEQAGLGGPNRPTLRTHDLRHTFASLLIAAGASVVFVASQMGHAKPTVTLDVYAHLFDARDHADKLAAILEANFAATLERPAAGDAITLHRDRAANSRFQIRYQTETSRTSGFAGQNAQTPP